MKALTLAMAVSMLAVHQLGATNDGAPTTTQHGSTATKSRPHTKAILFNTVDLVTSPGTGVDGADESQVQTNLNMSTLGFRVENEFGDNRVADDFTVPEGTAWDIQSITLFSYEYTGPQIKQSPAVSINLRIWDGAPNVFGSNVIWGDLSTDVLVSSEWTGIYRLLDSDEGNDDTRGIMANFCQVGTTLGSGTYWIEWRIEGSYAYDGPYAPPRTVVGSTTTGNGLRNYGDGWQDAVDVGQQGFPIAIEGDVITFDVPAPIETQIRDASQTELFLCQVANRPVLPEDEDYFPTWRHVFWGQDEVEGYHHRLYSGGSCSGQPTADSAWEIASSQTYHSFQIPSAAAGTYCWQVQAWLTNPWSSGSNIYGEWSDCCCFDVGIQPDFIISNPNPQIGEPIVFAITGIPEEIDTANWNLGGMGCDNTSAAQVCTSSSFNNCHNLMFAYASSGTKTVSLSVEIDGVTFTGPQKTLTVQNVGECQSAQPEILATPEISSIDDQTCGASTTNPSPYIRWGNIANNAGYRWRLSTTAGNLMQSGTTGTNVNLAVPDSLDPGSYRARVQARGDGVSYTDSEWSPDCVFTIEGTVEESVEFSWWPVQPKQGEKVRFVDQSQPVPTTWSWDLGDGSSSVDQHPGHVFESTGQFNVTLEAGFASGFRSIQKTVTVSGAVACGDNVCDSGETAWSCAADCALEPKETGRAGGSDRRPTVPAAAGEHHGSNNTVWFTEGTIFNPGDDSVSVVVEYTPVVTEATFQAGPFTLPSDQSLYWSNIVGELFNTTGSGALWVDATDPVLFVTRSYTDSPEGTFGQGFSGIRGKLTIGHGDGAVYLTGLRDDEKFRTNLYLQEVDGRPSTVRVTFFRPSGLSFKTKSIPVEGHSVKIQNMRAMLDGESVTSAYATLEVTAGEGRVALAASVIDNITGDPTSIDAIHPNQIAAKATESNHDLVAAVTHTKGSFGSVWRSRLTLTNPLNNPTQQVEVEFEKEYDRTGAVGDLPPITLTLQPGESAEWEDVLTDLFGIADNAKTQGALHIYSGEGVIVDSRTYNARADSGTLGLGIPAMQEDDMIRQGELGRMAGLKNTAETRTNVGLAEYSGEDTVVEVRFKDTDAQGVHIGTITRTVRAKSHLQVTKIFEELNVGNLQFFKVVAEVRVLSGGSIYAYATIIDNASGDATKYTTANR